MGIRWKIAMVGLTLAAAIAAVTVVAQPSARPAHAAGATVTVANYSFTDGTSGTSTTTINVGDTVTWTWANTNGVPHSTTSVSVPAAASGWDSGAHASPFTFGPVTFSVPGTYTYHCIVHPVQMTGTIIVQAASTSTPAPTSTTVLPTSTPVTPASTPVAATSTPTVPTTTPAATVAVPSSTAAPVASPTATSPSLIAPAPTTSRGGVAGAATRTVLPQTGTGSPSGGMGRGAWLTAALGAAIALALGGAAVVRARRMRRR